MSVLLCTFHQLQFIIRAADQENDGADTPVQAIEEAYENAVAGTRLEGWLPLQLLALVKEETLLAAVRQRGKISDLFQSLEGLINNTDPMAGSGFADYMHCLRGMVSPCLSGLEIQECCRPSRWHVDLQ